MYKISLIELVVISFTCTMAYQIAKIIDCIQLNEIYIIFYFAKNFIFKWLFVVNSIYVGLRTTLLFYQVLIDIFFKIPILIIQFLFYFKLILSNETNNDQNIFNFYHHHIYFLSQFHILIENEKIQSRRIYQYSNSHQLIQKRDMWTYI